MVLEAPTYLSKEPFVGSKNFAQKGFQPKERGSLALWGIGQK